jgi:hypothetical protein
MRECSFRPNVGATDATLRTALQSMRTVLQTIAIDAVPLLEGRGGALFIPFAGAPSYEAVRAFLNSLVLRAAASIPDTIVPEHKPHEEPASGKIEVTVRSNAPGRFSSLPYTLLGGLAALDGDTGVVAGTRQRASRRRRSRNRRSSAARRRVRAACQALGEAAVSCDPGGDARRGLTEYVKTEDPKRGRSLKLRPRRLRRAERCAR